MDVATDATVGQENIAPANPQADGALSARDAAKMLADIRWKRSQPEQPKEPAAPAKTEAVEPEPVKADEAEAAPVEQTSGEETEAVEPELPTIDPPRFWTSEAKEKFAALPRETQQYIVEREQQRDTEVRRTQNEHAEKLKGLTAKEQAAEQARQQYESALPAVLQALQDAQQGQFSDIRTMADVEKMAREDWPRYALWDAQQKKIAAVQQEMKVAQERQQADFRQKWNDFASKEDQAFAERAPEIADEKKGKSMREAALNVLHDVGFSDEELAKTWNGEASVSLRDHRIQLLIRDAVRLRDAQKAAAKPAAKPVPPVQKPGSAGPRVDQASLELESLRKEAYQSGNPRTMAKYLAARRSAATLRRA